jgi:putative lipoprotein (rSAM/lipoprotein system)
MKKIFSIILFVFFFISCEIHNGENYADFRVSGRVLDKATNQSIENIQISLRNKTLGVFAKTLTSKNGEFLIEALNGGYTIDSIFVIAQDIDSFQNGSYEKDSIRVYLHKNDGGFKLEPALAENLLLLLNKKD